MSKINIVRHYNVTSAGLLTIGDPDFGANVESITISNQSGTNAVVTLYDGGSVSGPERFVLLAPNGVTTSIPLFGAKFLNQIWVGTTQTIDITFVAEAAG